MDGNVEVKDAQPDSDNQVAPVDEAEQEHIRVHPQVKSTTHTPTPGVKVLDAQAPTTTQPVSNSMDVAQLVKQVTQLQKELQEVRSANETLSDSVAKSLRIQDVLADQVLDVPLVQQLLDMDSISLDGNTVVGLSDQLEKLRTSKPYLFKTGKVNIESSVKPVDGVAEVAKPVDPNVGKRLASLKKNQNAVLNRARNTYFKD